MQGVVDQRATSDSVVNDGQPGTSGKGSVGDTTLRRGRLQLVTLKFAILPMMLLLLSSCESPGGSSSLAGLYGREVLVTMEPTVISTATTSEVRERKMNGKLMAADDHWVILNIAPERVALSRDKVLSIAEAQTRP